MALLAERQSDADKDLVKKVCKHKDLGDPYHKRWCENAERRYALYRSYLEFKGEYRKTTPNDVDDYWDVAKRRFGAELFIPYSFSVIETIIPRMLSHHPKMLMLPRNQESETHAETVRQLVESQQEQMNYELVLQDVGKTGLIYGLGVQKIYWKTEKEKRKKMMKGIIGKYVEKEVEYTCYDDPDAIDVDPFDWIYDPFCSEMKDMDWCIHRTWRGLDYVRNKVETKTWRNIDVPDLEGAEPANPAERDKLWESRMEAAGMGGIDNRNNKLHEVWEFWNRQEVITVLDGTICVASGENPYWHKQLPFQVYRPTKVPRELPGIGAIEPIETLQHEMNSLRSQRRDNATLVLNKPFAYWDGLVDPDEIRFGAGSLIPTPGDPRELIRPLDVGDIPASGYQEEQGLQQDIERVSGISDPTSGAESASPSSQTATGVQLIQQAASIRIQNMTRRLEVETIGPGGKQMLELDQQKIRENREIRIPMPPDMSVDPAQRRWAWLSVGPTQLAGEWDVIPDGGATLPENIPQMRSDAQMYQQLLGTNTNLDQRKVLVEILRNLGLKHPEAYLLPPGPQFPPIDPNTVGEQIVQLLGGGGMDLPQAQQKAQEILQAGEQAAIDQRASAGNAQAGPPDQVKPSDAPDPAQPAV